MILRVSRVRAGCACLYLLTAGFSFAQTIINSGTRFVSGTGMNTGFQVWNSSLYLDVDTARNPLASSSTLTVSGMFGLDGAISGTIFAANTVVGVQSANTGVISRGGAFISLVSGTVKSIGNGVEAAGAGSRLVLDKTAISSAAGYGAWASGSGRMYINTGTNGVATGGTSALASGGHGLVAQTGGAINASGLTLTATNGNGAMALDAGSAITLGNFSITSVNFAGAQAESRGVITLSSGTVTAGGVGLFVQTGGTISGTGVTVRAGYLAATYATGAGSAINLTNFSLEQLAVTGAQAGGGARMTLTSGTISTGGYGMYTDTGGLITGTNVTINSGYLGAYTSSGTLRLNNTTITTTGGGAHAFNALNGLFDLSGTLRATTQGDGAYGFLLDGSAARISMPVTTSLIVKTTGLGAHGFAVANGAIHTFDSTQQLPSFDVTGAGSAYFASFGAGSKLSLVNRSFTTAADGVNVAIADGGALAFTGGTLATTAANTAAVVLSNGGTLTLSSNSVLRTTGDGSHALVVNGAANTLSLASTASVINVSGSGAHGILLQNLAALRIAGTPLRFDVTGAGSALMALTGTSTLTVAASVSGTRDGARGILARDGSAGILSTSSGLLTLTGSGVVGMTADGPGSIASVSSGGRIDVFGENAIGALATNGGGIIGNVGIISGTGANVIAVKAIGTGSASLYNTSVLATGSAARGLAADGAQARLRASLVFTTGVDTRGIHATSGGSADIDGTNIEAHGDRAHVLELENATAHFGGDGGMSTLNGHGLSVISLLAADSSAVSGSSANIYATGSLATAVRIESNSRVDLFSGQIQSIGLNAAGVSLITGGSATFRSYSISAFDTEHGGVAVHVADGAAITVDASSLYATGSGARGIVLDGPGASARFQNFGSVQADGMGGRAVLVQNGAQVDMNWQGPALHANGLYSALAEAAGAGSRITLSGNFGGNHAFTTIGNSVTGFLATDGGRVALDGDADVITLETRSGWYVKAAHASGTHASGAASEVSFRKTHILQRDAFSEGLYAENGGRITFADSALVVSNYYNNLAHAVGGGAIVINNSILSAGADLGESIGSIAIIAEGAGSTITATNATLYARIVVSSTLGDAGFGKPILDASGSFQIIPGVYPSHGIHATNAAAVAFDSGTIITGGVNSNAIRAEAGAVITLVNSHVETLGDAAYAISAAGSTFGAANINVVTHGGQSGNLSAVGLVAEGGGEVSINDIAGMPASAITTLGDKSVAALAQVRGANPSVTQLTLAGVSGSPIQISTAGLAAHGVEVVTVGGTAAAIIDLPFGATNVAEPVAAASGSLANVAIVTAGEGALGLYALGSLATITARDITVSTTGAGAHGAGVSQGALLTLASSTIATHGDLAAGVALTGSSSRATFDGAGNRITTTGERAHAITVLDGATLSFDGAASFFPSVKVSGPESAVLNASGAGSTVSMAGDSALSAAMATADTGWGAIAADGARIQFSDTARSGSAALRAAAGGTIAFRDGAAGDGSRVVVDADAAFDLAGLTVAHGLAIASLEGQGHVAFGAAAVPLTIDGARSTVFSGTIGGDGSLVKNGLSTLTFTTTSAFAYTGSTAINGGVLAIRNFDLPTTESFTKTITLNGGWLDLSNVTVTGSDSWGNLIIINGPDSASGGVIGKGDAISFDVTAGAIETENFQIGGTTADTQGVYLVKTGGGTLVLTGSNTYVGNTRVLGGILQVSHDYNLGNTTAVTPRDVTLSSGTLALAASFASAREIWLEGQGGALDVAPSVTATWAGLVMGDSTAAFAKTGEGTLVLTGENTHGGVTTIASGTLQLGDGGVTGRIAGDIVNNAALVFHRADDIGYAQHITGTGFIAKRGADALTLSASGNTAGSVAVEQGTLRLAAGSSLAASSAAIAPDATLDLAGALAADVTSSGTILVSNAAAAGATLTLAGDLANNGVLDFTRAASASYNTLRITGNYTGVSRILLRANLAALTGDKLVINGAAAGTHKVSLVLTPDAPLVKNTALWLIQTDAGPSAPGAFIIDNNGADYIESGVLALRLYQGDGGTIMPDFNRWYLAGADKRSNAADVIVTTASIIAAEWFYDLDNIHKRMGEVRMENLNSNSETPGSALAGNVWFRANGYRLNGSAALGGASFHENVYGGTLGFDKAWGVENGIVLTGGFIGVGHVDRTFDNSVGDGNTGSLAAGLYASWLRPDGWYADAVLKIDRYKNEFNARAVDGHISTGNYSNIAAGLSLELGRRLEHATAAGIWWVEPFAQIAGSWIEGAGYTTTTDVSVRVDDTVNAQYRGMLRFGYDKAKWNGFRPYAKFGMAKIDGGGLLIRADHRTFASDIGGWRFEAGFGAVYAVDARSQMYLDYEYSKAVNYERPWNLNFGYRRLW